MVNEELVYRIEHTKITACWMLDYVSSDDSLTDAMLSCATESCSACIDGMSVLMIPLGGSVFGALLSWTMFESVKFQIISVL